MVCGFFHRLAVLFFCGMLFWFFTLFLCVIFHCHLLVLSGSRSPWDSILKLSGFGLFNSLSDGSDITVVCVGFGRERIVSLGCALDLLCILDLWSLSALGHGKRRRIHGIDLTGGIYNGSDSVGGVGGFPFALAPALVRSL